MQVVFAWRYSGIYGNQAGSNQSNAAGSRTSYDVGDHILRTRNEEMLLGERIEKHNKLRRLLHDRSPAESMNTLLKLIANTSRNEELLDSM